MKLQKHIGDGVLFFQGAPEYLKKYSINSYIYIYIFPNCYSLTLGGLAIQIGKHYLLPLRNLKIFFVVLLRSSITWQSLSRSSNSIECNYEGPVVSSDRLDARENTYPMCKGTSYAKWMPMIKCKCHSKIISMYGICFFGEQLVLSTNVSFLKMHGKLA